MVVCLYDFLIMKEKKRKENFFLLSKAVPIFEVRHGVLTTPGHLGGFFRLAGKIAPSQLCQAWPQPLQPFRTAGFSF